MNVRGERARCWQHSGVTWYVAAYGPATIITLSTERSMAADSPQLAWLRTTLAAVDRARTPWVIVQVSRQAPLVLNSCPPTLPSTLFSPLMPSQRPAARASCF